LGQPGKQRVADALQYVPGDGADHQDREFISSQAIRTRFLAANFAQQGGALLDHPVAYEVAVLIVDGLEAVQVDERQRLGLTFAEPHIVQVQRTPVRHGGERIFKAEVFELAYVRQSEPHHQHHGCDVGRATCDHDCRDRGPAGF
jgi:hypothetical protein